MRSEVLARDLGRWYAAHARVLPWRDAPTPWAVLVSEVLLQQTRVETARAAFPALMARFPSPQAMARASEEDVLRAWAGLGYYRRARNLHATSQRILQEHDGSVPREPSDLAALPGVGPYTAAAVRAFAFDEPAAPLDANVIRVLARLTGETALVETPAARARLAEAALEVLAHGSPRVLGQALMELGALVCTPAPRCAACPVQRACVARARDLQHVLPRRAPKAKPALERWAFVRAVHRGRVLLERRGPGLLEGFWALPGVQLRRGAEAPELLAARLEALGVRAKVGAASDRGSWAFTHRTWRFRIHDALVRGPPRAHAPARWVAPGTLPELPVARPHLPHLPRTS